MSKRITIFQWGYDGWGNGTKHLVRSFDAVEGKRGYEPPIFVDVRFSRSVRAVGFRGRAFETKFRHARYRWMPSLGNAAIGSSTGKIRIQCPDAVEQLLDLAIDSAKINRRLIFFCSCPSPDGAEWCHRTTVAKLMVRAARRRGVPVEIREWPGAAPTRKIVTSVKVTDDCLRRVLRGAKRVPLCSGRASADLMHLPHGALVELKAPSGRQIISVQPPEYRGKLWYLPLFIVPAEEGHAPATLWKRINRLRKEYAIEPRRS